MNIKKTIAACMAVNIFLTNGIFIHAAERNFWSDRKKTLTQVQLPSEQPFLPPVSFARHTRKNPFAKDPVSPSLGQLTEEAFTEEKEIPTVFLIQDVHLNSEAQNNIGKTIDQLVQTQNIQTIALEGAFGPLDLSAFQHFQYPEALKTGADYLLRENKISGALHTALLFPKGKSIPVVGVDHPVHYKKNVQAYLEASKLQTKFRASLEKQKKKLVNLKSIVLNNALKSFDDQVVHFREGSLGVGEYARFLSTLRSDLPPNIKRIIEAIACEAQLPLGKIERERSILVQELMGSLDSDEMAQLNRACSAYKSGNLREMQFYLQLKYICQKNSIDLARLPAIESYIRYVSLADQLHPAELYKEIRFVENDIYEKLTSTKQERELIQKDRKTFLSMKLVNFFLSSDEWSEYQTLVPENIKNPFERFYREAQKRDEAMAGNFVDNMRTWRDKKGVGIFVVGGFHSHGITDRLKKSGCKVISFTPRISSIETAQGSVYLNEFAQEKTPLEKMFQGEKLFLSQPVWNKAIVATLASLSVASAIYSGASIKAIDFLNTFPFMNGLTPLQFQTGGSFFFLFVDPSRAVNITLIKFIDGSKIESVDSVIFEFIPSLAQSVCSLPIILLGSAFGLKYLIGALKKSRVSRREKTLMVASVVALSFFIGHGGLSSILPASSKIIKWHEDWKPVVEFWSYVVAIVAFPVLIWQIWSQSKKELENDDEETFQRLTDGYRNVLDLISKHPELKLRTQVSPDGNLSPEQIENRQIIFESLTSLFEEAHILLYGNDMEFAAQERWDTWQDYMQEWLLRPDFRVALPKLLIGENPDFAAYISALAKTMEPPSEVNEPTEDFVILSEGTKTALEQMGINSESFFGRTVVGPLLETVWYLLSGHGIGVGIWVGLEWGRIVFGFSPIITQITLCIFYTLWLIGWTGLRFAMDHQTQRSQKFAAGLFMGLLSYAPILYSLATQNYFTPYLFSLVLFSTFVGTFIAHLFHMGVNAIRFKTQTSKSPALWPVQSWNLNELHVRIVSILMVGIGTSVIIHQGLPGLLSVLFFIPLIGSIITTPIIFTKRKEYGFLRMRQLKDGTTRLVSKYNYKRARKINADHLRFEIEGFIKSVSERIKDVSFDFNKGNGPYSISINRKNDSAAAIGKFIIKNSFHTAAMGFEMSWIDPSMTRQEKAQILKKLWGGLMASGIEFENISIPIKSTKISGSGFSSKKPNEISLRFGLRGERVDFIRWPSSKVFFGVGRLHGLSFLTSFWEIDLTEKDVDYLYIFGFLIESDLGVFGPDAGNNDATPVVYLVEDSPSPVKKPVLEKISKKGMKFSFIPKIGKRPGSLNQSRVKPFQLEMGNYLSIPTALYPNFSEPIAQAISKLELLRDQTKWADFNNLFGKKTIAILDHQSQVAKVLNGDVLFTATPNNNTLYEKVQSGGIDIFVDQSGAPLSPANIVQMVFNDGSVISICHFTGEDKVKLYIKNGRFGDTSKYDGWNNLVVNWFKTFGVYESNTVNVMAWGGAFLALSSPYIDSHLNILSIIAAAGIFISAMLVVFGWMAWDLFIKSSWIRQLNPLLSAIPDSGNKPVSLISGTNQLASEVDHVVEQKSSNFETFVPIINSWKERFPDIALPYDLFMILEKGEVPYVLHRRSDVIFILRPSAPIRETGDDKLPFLQIPLNEGINDEDDYIVIDLGDKKFFGLDNHSPFTGRSLRMGLKLPNGKKAQGLAILNRKEYLKRKNARPNFFEKFDPIDKSLQLEIHAHINEAFRTLGEKIELATGQDLESREKYTLFYFLGIAPPPLSQSYKEFPWDAWVDRESHRLIPDINKLAEGIYRGVVSMKNEARDLTMYLNTYLGSFMVNFMSAHQELNIEFNGHLASVLLPSKILPSITVDDENQKTIQFGISSLASDHYLFSSDSKPNVFARIITGKTEPSDLGFYDVPLDFLMEKTSTPNELILQATVKKSDINTQLPHNNELEFSLYLENDKNPGLRLWINLENIPFNNFKTSGFSDSRLAPLSIIKIRWSRVLNWLYAVLVAPVVEGWDVIKTIDDAEFRGWWLNQHILPLIKQGEVDIAAYQQNLEQALDALHSRIQRWAPNLGLFLPAVIFHSWHNIFARYPHPMGTLSSVTRMQETTNRDLLPAESVLRNGFFFIYGGLKATRRTSKLYLEMKSHRLSQRAA